jgi:RND superfamily putative drug exporter
MSGRLYRLGRACVRRRRLVLVVWVLAVVAIGAVSRAAGGGFSDDFRVPGVESQRAHDLLRERFPEKATATAQVVLRVEDGTLRDERPAAAVRAALERVGDLPRVREAPDPIATGALSADGRTALSQVGYDADVTDLGAVALDELDAELEPLREAGVTAEIGGELAQYAEQPETGTAELIGVLAAVVILLLAFGSVLAMGLPIGVALFGLGAGVSLVTLLGAVIDITTSTPTIASMIGIGVGIDYALFIVTRHRQHLVEGMTVEEAAGRANATSGQAVIFAGGTVVIAICGLALVGIPMVATMGYGAAITVAVMVAASVTLLPALLGFAGMRLASASLPWARRKEAHDAEWAERLERLGAPPRRTRWERWGHHVARHPWVYVVAGGALLVTMALPVLGMRLGQTDASNKSESFGSRRAFDLIADGFGPGYNSPLLLTVELSGDRTADRRALSDLGAALAEDEGVEVALPAEVNGRGDAAVVIVVPTTAPQDRETASLVHRIRRDIVPDVLGGTGVDAHVGGLNAVFIDLSDKIAARLPAFIGSVVALSFVLLMMVFRSVVVPLKAALLNVLSIGAAYGVVVAVFQWGWLKALVGLDDTVPIVSFVPMFMFAILFGLSMDYEVFLLSRVREEHLAGRSNTESVIDGIASTARVITSAALIMIAVFFGFVLGEDPIVKMMGLGLATAVLVDATVVRIVLVPATMRLMGAANWWLPAWLDRALPHLDVEGGLALPEPELRVRHPAFDGDGREHPERVLAET